MAKEPFVSGVYRPEPEKPAKSIKEIVDTAVEVQRRKRSLHQRYASRGTTAVKRATNRMLGERE